MDCSPPGSSVYGISQARTLEWIAISSSRGSTLVDGCFTTEPPGKPQHFISYFFFFYSMSAIPSHDCAVHSHGHTFNLVMIFRSLRQADHSGLIADFLCYSHANNALVLLGLWIHEPYHFYLIITAVSSGQWSSIILQTPFFLFIYLKYSVIYNEWFKVSVLQ